MNFKRSDLPQFIVQSIDKGASDDDGYAEWTLHGQLNRTDNIPTDQWCYLLHPRQADSLTGTFTLSNEGNFFASFATHTKGNPEIVGLTMSQLGSYWQPRHVWMVEAGSDSWSEHVFSSSDAVEDTFLGTDGQIWRRLTKASETSKERLAPSHLSPENEGHSSVKIIAGGWDHEHCSLCNVHIDPGDKFCYSADYCEYICVKCYERYVRPRNLGFIFE